MPMVPYRFVPSANLSEATCHFLLDSRCFTTVCGEKGFECFIDTLSDSRWSTII